MDGPFWISYSASKTSHIQWRGQARDSTTQMKPSFDVSPILTHSLAKDWILILQRFLITHRTHLGHLESSLGLPTFKISSLVFLKGVSCQNTTQIHFTQISTGRLQMPPSSVWSLRVILFSLYHSSLTANLYHIYPSVSVSFSYFHYVSVHSSILTQIPQKSSREVSLHPDLTPACTIGTGAKMIFPVLKCDEVMSWQKCALPFHHA